MAGPYSVTPNYQRLYLATGKCNLTLMQHLQFHLQAAQTQPLVVEQMDNCFEWLNS